jgi:hypothetical protein
LSARVKTSKLIKLLCANGDANLWALYIWCTCLVVWYLGRLVKGPLHPSPNIYACLVKPIIISLWSLYSLYSLSLSGWWGAMLSVLSGYSMWTVCGLNYVLVVWITVCTEYCVTITVPIIFTEDKFWYRTLL